MTDLLKKSIYLLVLCGTILYCKKARVDASAEVKSSQWETEEMTQEEMKLSQSGGIEKDNVLLSLFGNSTQSLQVEEDATASSTDRGSDKKLYGRDCALPCPDSAYANKKLNKTLTPKEFKTQQK